MKSSAYIGGVRVFGFSDGSEILGHVHDKDAILIAVNPEKIMRNDPDLNEIINRNVGYPDGIGVVMALRQKGVAASRIPGAELWRYIVSRNREKSIYLVGSSQDVIEKTVVKLNVDIPGINIAGYQNGYFGSGDKEMLVQDLIRTRPDVVFVAQGSPRQEFLMNELIQCYPALYMGLGGSFDVYVGAKKRAPRFFRKWHLEWFYRLLKEPTRAGRQLALGRFMLLYIFRKL